MRAARIDIQAVIGINLQRDLRPVRELSRNIIKRMGGGGYLAWRANIGGGIFGNFNIQISRDEAHLAAFGAHQHI